MVNNKQSHISDSSMSGVNFESLFAHLPERYVVMDAHQGYKMIAANDAYLAVTGKSREQVIGKGLFEVFPDTSERALKTGKGELETSFEKVIKTDAPDSTGVIRYDLEDGNGKMSVRYWQATHYPIREGKKITAILQSTADVTDIVMSSEELKLANIKLDEAKKAGLVGSWSWDIAKDMVTADRGLSDLFGISEEDALKGLPLEIFLSSIYEPDRDMVTGIIQQTLDSGESFECEYRTIDSEKHVRWVIARGRVERDEKGKPTHFPGVMIDISSRKEAEARLMESEQRLRFMADTMPQLVWITRPDGYHEYYNQPWYDYTGTTPGSTDGEGWNGLFHEDDRERARDIWQHSLKTGEIYEIKYRLYHAPSKTYRWVIGRARPYRDDNGEIIKWYGTCTDIDDSVQEIEMRKRLEAELNEEKDRLESRVAERTSQLRLTNEGLRKEVKKRQRAEARLRKSSEELQRSNKELEEFAYVSSHDLQEPLRKIQAFSDLVMDEYGDKIGDGEMYLSRIKASASRMSSLIEDLLAFSRVTTKPAVTQHIDLNETFEHVLLDLQERIERENGSVAIDGKLPIINADATHMRQLFQNLLSNSLKFHAVDTPPRVEVSVKKSDDMHCIVIKDYGIGIDEKYKEKVFAVFQRLNTKQAYEGTGIGLAVCKKIVDRYGGTIELESQLGKGTTFTICLPAGLEGEK
jgi:PAS domain S-box-containing protein